MGENGMKVTLSLCWGGGEKYCYRLEWRDKSTGKIFREYVSGDTWKRAQATEAKDLLQSVYGIARETIRFTH